MSDLLDKFGVSGNDINLAKIPSINSQGQPVGRPSGNIAENPTADLPQGKVDPNEIDLGAVGADEFGNPTFSDNQDLMDLGSNNTENPPDISTLARPQVAEDAAPLAEAPIDNKPKDLLDKYGIDAPSPEDLNKDALQTGVELNHPSTPVPVQTYVDQNIKQMDVIAKSRFSEDQIAEMSNNPMSWIEGFNMVRSDQILPFGGFNQAYQALDTKKIAEKQSRGEVLSESESKQLGDFVDRQVILSKRGFTWGGQIAYIAPQIPAFVAEYVAAGLVTGGGSTAAAVGTKVAEEVATKAVLKKVTNTITKSAAKAAFMPAQYTAKYGEARLNDSIAITDKGQLILKDNQEAPAITALKAFSYTMADVLGQEVAPAIGKFIVKPAEKVLKTPLVYGINKIPTQTRAALYDAFKTIQPNAQVSKVFTAAGWSGMLEQLGANRVSEIMKATTNLTLDADYTTDQYLDAITPTKENLMVEAGLVGIAGGIHASSNIVFNVLKNKGVKPEVAKTTVDNMSSIEKDNFIEKELPTPKSGFPDVQRDSITIKSEDINLPKTKVVDSEGKPLVVYHGSSDMSFTQGEGFKKDGVNWFATNPKFTEFYTGGNEGRGTIPVYLDIKQPVDFTNVGSKDFVTLKQYLDDAKVKYSESELSKLHKETDLHPQDTFKRWQGIQEQPAIKEFLSEKGFDGIIQNEGLGDTQSLTYAAFNPEQIKYKFDQRSLDQADGIPVANTYNPEADMVKSQINSVEKSDPPPIDDAESNFNKAYREGVDDIYQLVKLEQEANKLGFEVTPKNSPSNIAKINRNISQLVRYNLVVGTTRRGEDGRLITTGKSDKAIKDDFDNMFLKIEPNKQKRKDDFDNYVISHRLLELSETRKDVLVTDKQKSKAIAHLAYIQDKYGADATFFETFAQEGRDFDDRILYNLVRSGIKSQQWYNELTSSRSKYVSLQRVMDETNEQLRNDGINSRLVNIDPNANKVIKKIKGSEKEIRDITLNRIANTTKILHLSATNDLLNAISKFADIIPTQVQVKDVPIVKKGTTKSEVYYDPTLRNKLETMIKDLGGRVEREKTLKVKGIKNVLGYYSNAEKLIKLRIGVGEGTLAHEAGHQLDYHLGLDKLMLKDSDIKKELQLLAESRLGADVIIKKEDVTEGERKFQESISRYGSDKYMKYLKNDREVIANFFDAYVNSPELAKEQAPKAYAAFNKIIDERPELAYIKQIRPSTARQAETIEQDLYGKSKEIPHNSIPFYQNGQRKYLTLSKPMYESFKNLDPATVGLLASWIGKPFEKSARLLTMGATITPEFILRNPIRDLYTAFMQTGDTLREKTTPIDFMRGMFHIMSKSDKFEKWSASGGRYGAAWIDLSSKSLEKIYKEFYEPDGKITRYSKNPLLTLKDTSDVFEMSTRLGTYLKKLDLGQTEIEAAVASLESTLNFQTMGSTTRKANKYISFLGVQVNAANRLVETFKKNPAATTFWAMSTLTVPSMMLTGYYLYGADEKTRKAYLETSTLVKQLTWPIIVDGEIVGAFPKPGAFGYVFATLPEQMMLYLDNDDIAQNKATWLDMVKGFAGSVSPIQDVASIMPPIFKAAVENITNHNFFLDKEIYPKWLEGDTVAPEDKVNAYTSETAKILGKKFGISPALIDNDIKALTGGAGKYALDAGDLLLKQVREFNGEKGVEKPITNADIPIIKAFSARRPAGFRSNSAKNFQTNWAMAQQAHKKAKSLEGQEKATFTKENNIQLNQYGQLHDSYKEMRLVQKEIDAVTTKKGMTSEEKVKRIGNLEDKITMIARAANLRYNKAKEKAQ